jgi:hypothetical protein
MQLLELRMEQQAPDYPVELLEQLFITRCEDMHIPVLKEHWLRFMDKFIG